MIETPSHPLLGIGVVSYFLICLEKPALSPFKLSGSCCPRYGKNRRSARTLVGCTWKGRFKGTLILVIGVFCFLVSRLPFDLTRTPYARRWKHYHLIITLPQVKPLPNAARTTRSPSLIFPSSQASVRAIGILAAVVLPYRMILLYTWSSESLNFF